MHIIKPGRYNSTSPLPTYILHFLLFELAVRRHPFTGPLKFHHVTTPSLRPTEAPRYVYQAA